MQNINKLGGHMFEDRINELYEKIDTLRNDTQYRTTEIKFLERLLLINPSREIDISKAITANKARIELNNVGIQGCLDDITSLTIRGLDETGADLI